MKKYNLYKNIALMSAVVIGFASCDKVKEVEPIGDRGQTVVKLVNGGDPGHVLNGIDFVNRSQTVDVADIRRDVSNTAEMNRTMNIVIKDDTAALRQYNIDNDKDLQIMPTSWYTLNIPRSGPGGTYSITLAPGELAKQISITVPDATLLSPSETYGFPFTIVSADADGKVSVNKTMIYEIGAKNKYDGVYSLRGIHNRPTYQFPYEQKMYMITTGASEVAFYFVSKGDFGHPIGTGPDIVADVSWYGAAIGPRVVFDPVTDKVTNVYNAGGATVIDIYTGPGSGQGRFESGTKKMYVYWRYNQNNDRAFMDTLTYIEPR